MPSSARPSRPPAARRRRASTARLGVVVSLAAAIAALYFAQEVLIPLALSVMLAFVLAPLVRRAERYGLKRVPAVLVAVTVTAGVLGLLGWVVTRQVLRLAEDLPKYQDEIVAKVKRVSAAGSGGMFAKFEAFSEKVSTAPEAPSKPATEPAATGPAATQQATRPVAGDRTGVVGAAVGQMAQDPTVALAREATKAGPATAPAATPPAPIGTTPANPFFAVALPAPVSPIRTLGTYLGLALGPLGNAGLVLVFVVFMLLDWEDLRNRLIRLISRGRYTVTTRAINDAGTRISKYVLAQAAVNGSYGLVIGIGLWVIGLTMGHGTGFPSFVLWALLCAVLRFVPYIGPGLAMLFPIGLSLAVYPGFSVFAATVSLFVVIELLSNNIMEPMLYGASTGLSTVAIMVAAVFWTWLWGPVGLLLSTPLTVCLVVLGKHVPQLGFLDVLLGDQPALPAGVTFYQRLLARDPAGAAAVAKAAAAADGPDAVPDTVLVRALKLARRDRLDGELTPDGETAVLEGAAAVIELASAPPAAGKGDSGGAAAAAVPVEPAASGPLVLGCPAHHRSEELALQALAAVLRPAGCATQVLSTRLLVTDVEARVGRDRPALVVIAVLPPGGLVQCRYLCRRLRRKHPDLPILVAYLGRVRQFDKLLVRLRKAGASYVNTSILQTRSQIVAMLPALAAAATGGGDPTVAAAAARPAD